MPTVTDLRLLLRHPVDFELADDPQASRFVFATPTGSHRAKASDAVGPLSQGIRTMGADPSVRAWATPAILALRLMAKGQLNDPASIERSQLHDASRSLDVDPVAARAKIEGFLAALATELPAVASAKAPPRRLRATLQIEFLPVPHPDVERQHTAGEAEPQDARSRSSQRIAQVNLRVRPIDSAWAPVDARDLWQSEHHAFGVGSRQSCRELTERIGDLWPPAHRLTHLLMGQTPFLVTADELALLGKQKVVRDLHDSRVDILWPSELVRDLESTAILSPSNELAHRKHFGVEELFTFNWQLAISGEALTQAEVDALAASRHGLLRLRDQWVFLEPERLREVIEQRDSREVNSVEALWAAATGSIDLDGRTTEVRTTGWLAELRDRLIERGQHNPISAPSSLAGELRDYQLNGLRWMAQLLELGLGGILADDMGLGKTVMVISLHLHRAEQFARAGVAHRPTLVVCPASVVSNWENEIRRFAPSTDIHRHHGPGRNLADVRTGIVITTYATMRRDAQALRDHPGGWDLVVADEAQNVKNPRSAVARELRTIDSSARVALTGTPVENNLTELWAILDWAIPGLLGSQREFAKRWARPIEHADVGRADLLARLVGPFVLRRRKTDPGIAPELPPKTETDYRVKLTKEQVGLYQAAVDDSMTKLGDAHGITRRALVVRLLTQLKQICNHPAQFLREASPELSGRSGKLALLEELLNDILASDGATLVFTQYAQMGELLQRHLQSRGIDSQFLHGSTSLRTRDEMVGRFQSGQVPVFLLSLRAAGTGLNLTRADHVIHFDRWWNPAVEDQATDRAHRIGQTHPVQVHRIICSGTIEESVAQLIEGKRQLADAVINAGASALTELSDAELLELVRLS